VRDELYFSFGQALRSKGELRIYDATGRLQQVEYVDRLMISKHMDVSVLSEGIYYYQLVVRGELYGGGSFMKI
jgi:hypothetical protein